jgi:ABC-type nitrate/sulfonate/bicarbonate transport system permease component
VNQLLSRFNFLVPLFGVVLFLAIWYLAVSARIIDPVLLPTPQVVGKAIWTGVFGGRIGADLWKTVQRVVIAVSLAAAIGIPIGVVLGASRRVYHSLEFIIDFFRSTPASAVFPLFLVIFGVDDRTKIYIGTFGALLAIVFNTAYGVMNARKTRVLAARVMGANRRHILLVVLLESLPQTFIGLRTGVSISLISVIVAEMFLGSSDGIGARVFEAEQIFDMPQMYAAIFCSGLLGYVLNLGLSVSERSFVHWAGR